MTPTVVPRLRDLALMATLAVSPWLVACASDEGDTSSGEPAAASVGAVTEEPATGTAGARRYDVRGQVVRVPDPADPQSDLVIRHEAIPDFVGIDGDEVGMSSMAMPFPVAPGVSLAEIVPGDKIAFTLEVDWEAEPAYRIIRIEKLPETTELAFAKEASSSEPAAGGMIPLPEDYPVIEPPVV